MTKPDNAPCGNRRNPGALPSTGTLAFFVLLGERLKVNPNFTAEDLHKELAEVSACFQSNVEAKQKKEKK
jgi:hypothetical protein